MNAEEKMEVPDLKCWFKDWNRRFTDWRQVVLGEVLKNKK